jgi:hypothetical protein
MLKWIAPLDIINGNWRQGRSNVESPKKIRTNCAAYISKYLIKMRGWSDLHLALLWSGRSRMYGFSRGFSVKIENKESDWQRWHVIEANDLELLERSLEEGGFTIERDAKTEPSRISQGRAPARSQTLTLTNISPHNPTTWGFSPSY